MELARGSVGWEQKLGEISVVGCSTWAAIEGRVGVGKSGSKERGEEFGTDSDAEELTDAAIKAAGGD